MRIGPYELNAVETGEFRLDGGAMFGVVPKVLWEKTNPADASNRIQMNVRSLLIRGGGRSILVDSGLGDKWTERQQSMFAIDHGRYQIDRSLASLGVKREEITDVVISHLHFDHVGGATRFGADGTAVELSFPNATYYVQKANIAHAHAPTEKDRASFLEETIRPLLASARLKVIEGDYEIAPGVFSWPTDGHTPGHQMVKVTDGKTTLVCCGDTIPTASHIPVPYVMGYDLYPLTTMAEKRVLLEQAERESWILFWVHDPFVQACTVQVQNGRYSRAKDVPL